MKTPLLLLTLLLLAAALAVALSPHPYAAQDRQQILAPASPSHPAGTDPLGRDRLVRSSAALLLGLTGATLAAALTTLIAAAVGSLAAFAPPILAAILMLFSDLFLSLPWLFLLMIVRSTLPLTASPLHSAAVTFAILAALGWPACARAVFRGARRLRHADPMIHARALGLRPLQLVRLHVLPNLRPLLLPQFLLCIPAFLIAEANLGTLGLGIAEPLPSFGALLLELSSSALSYSALLSRSLWVYLPIILLVAVLLLLDRIVDALTSERATT